MNLTIGCAQFGFKYGFKKNKITKRDLKKISETLKKNNLRFFDTATSYGNSEKVIGNFDIKNKKIITKIILPKKKVNLGWYKNMILNSLKNLKVNRLYGLLFHKTSDIIDNKEIFLINIQTKKKNLVTNIVFRL